MTKQPIPADVKAFILEHIDSITQLEALLLLRTSPEAEWDVTKAARQLYVPESVATDVLARLLADGFLSRNRQAYRYSPKSSELAEMVDRVAEVYRRYLIPVTNLIHGNPRRLRQFADAFKFRKDQ